MLTRQKHVLSHTTTPFACTLNGHTQEGESKFRPGFQCRGLFQKQLSIWRHLEKYKSSLLFKILVEEVLVNLASLIYYFSSCSPAGAAFFSLFPVEDLLGTARSLRQLSKYLNPRSSLNCYSEECESGRREVTEAL